MVSTIFCKRGAVLIAMLAALAFAAPASAAFLNTTGPASNIVNGALTIQDYSCTASGSGNQGCGTVAWSVSGNAATGLFIALTPTGIWTTTDINVTFLVTDALGAQIRSAGTAVAGTGIAVGGLLVRDSSDVTVLASQSAPYINTDPSKNAISFAPQSVVYLNYDFRPQTGNLTLAAGFVGLVPEPASIMALLTAGIMLAGVRFRRT